MRFFLAIFLLCASTANASVYHYKYQGHELTLKSQPDYELYKDPNNNPTGEVLPIAEPTRAAFAIDLWINTAYLPGGILQDFVMDWDFDRVDSGFVRVKGNNGLEDWSDVPHLPIRYAFFKFDADADITAWDLGLGWDAPYHGPRVSTEKDYSIFWLLDEYRWESEQPGTWTLVSDDAVAPIPLPASALFLIGALGGLGALRRRRRAL